MWGPRPGQLGCALQCVLVARMVREDEWIMEHARAGRWQHRRLWLDLPSEGRSDKQARRRRRREKRDRERRERAAPAVRLLKQRKEEDSKEDRDLELGRVS